ncbi:MAG: SOS response-associated peptidase [Deltaproteobacteria bacterium]|nr:SOS response-associated peptidase [Deltaproteobacteria bacterium]
MYFLFEREKMHPRRRSFIRGYKMCARTYVKTKSSVLAQLFSAHERDSFHPAFNIAPTDALPVVRVNPNQGERELVTTRWGLVPPWSKDTKSAARCINARAETVAGKPSFRSAFVKRRCVVVTDGFYEWRKEGKKRIPFAIHDPQGAPLAMAGLWELWKDPVDPEVRLRSSTILTTSANEDIENLHHRMPVLLQESGISLWLSDTQDSAALQEILLPAPAHSLVQYEVSPVVNQVHSTGPELLFPANS